jgi:hypothetical protein
VVKSFSFHVRASQEMGAQTSQEGMPSCASVSLKLQVQLFCDEPKKAPFSGYLAGFRMRALTFIYLHDI